MKFTLIAALLPLAACSQVAFDEQEASDEAAAQTPSAGTGPAMRDAATPDAAGHSIGQSVGNTRSATGPAIEASVAPGVAFAYRYVFSLPGDAIARVQQQHAAACEKLGLARCRVTGMNYVKNGEGIDARLDMLVAPDVANRLGGDSIAIVENADGTLSDANVSGDNAGGAIDASQRRSKALAAELTRLTKRVGGGGLGKDERAAMDGRIDALQRQLATEHAGREESELAIATTPMQYVYGSRGLFSASESPFGNAANASFASAANLMSMLLTVLGIALPWMLLGGLGWLAIRHVALRRRLAAASRTAISGPSAQG